MENIQNALKLLSLKLGFIDNQNQAHVLRSC